MTASPETLHLLAHSAQLKARTADDWWDNPLDTGLAAISATRHPTGHRETGEVAVDRLRRWWRDGEPRRVSSDAAALCLCAAAAADLSRRDRQLEAAAADAVTDLAGRTASAVPPLHLALCAWALDRVRRERDEAPWPRIRQHCGAAQQRGGVASPLLTLTSALAVPQFDAPGLVRTLLNEVPVSPGVEDGPVLLWLMTVAIERCSTEIPQSDAGLRALTDKRTELTQRLAQELDQEAFQQPEVSDFTPEADLDLRPVIYVSPTEALLLDISLASGERERPWLRFEEAEGLFNARGRKAEELLAKRTAILLIVIGVLAGALSGVVASSFGLRDGLSLLLSLAVATVVWLVATTVRYRQNPSTVLQGIGTLCAVVWLGALAYIVNGLLNDPVLGSIADYMVSTLLGGVGAVIWNLLVAPDRESKRR